MVHNAYDSFQLLSGCPTKIDVVESYGSKLLVGCSDGALRIYAPESSAAADHSPPSDPNAFRREPYSLEKTIIAFSKKPIISMEVLAVRELLVSLSESIAFHRLPNLETMAVITKAKGANVFCWDDRRGFLCFARQKRVCIFRHDGGRGFVEVKDFGVPDTVKSMSWCGENICLGIRKEYVILNATNGALSEVFPSGKLAPPLVVSLPSRELLLGKENIGVFVDQNGKLLQADRICWSEPPMNVVIQNPYAIALIPRRIEIRSLRIPYPLIQTIVLPNIRHLVKSSNAVIVASENSICGLFPVPLGAQIVQLTASGNFEEALALCKMLPPEDSSLRAAKEGSIHIRYAHSLFDTGNYEEAMEHFLASQVDITYVLSLYPSIILPKTTAIPEPEKLLEMSFDDPHLSRGLSGLSDDMDSQLPTHVSESDENATLEFKKMNHNTLMALIKFLQKKRFSIIERATTEGTEEVVLDAVGDTVMSTRLKKSYKGRGAVLINSAARDMATILDTALLHALLLTGQSSAALELLKGLNYCDLKISEEILQGGQNYAALLELYKFNVMHREALRLLHNLVEESSTKQSQGKFSSEMIIDYLKPLCATDPMLVLEFSMLVLDSCPTKTIELFLSENIPADLVNSYLKQHAPNMQGKYLEQMLTMNENGISGNLQNEMVKSCSEVLSLVPVPFVCLSPETGWEIVQIYLAEILDWHAELSAQQKWDEKAYSPTRKKLLSALDSISGYSPEVLLNRLPPDALFEERAILLGKINQHELALSLYVHKLHAPELAMAYCDRVYSSMVNQAAAKSSSNIYLMLLQIYLNPRKIMEKQIMNLVSPQSSTTRTSVKARGARGVRKIASIEGAEDLRISPSGTDSSRSDGDGEEPNDEAVSSTMLDQVVDILSQRWDRINGAQALKLLPRETKLKNLLSFLEPLLKKSSEAYRNLSVIKSLRQSENLQVKCELYEQRKEVVKITGESTCSLCNKKIGTSVFAVYPNGTTLVHFVCFRDSQSMKAMGKASSRKR